MSMEIAYHSEQLLLELYIYKIKKSLQLHAVSRTQQSRQRQPSVNTLRSPFPASSGGIACCTIKILCVFQKDFLTKNISYYCLKFLKNIQIKTSVRCYLKV